MASSPSAAMNPAAPTPARAVPSPFAFTKPAVSVRPGTGGTTSGASTGASPQPPSHLSTDASVLENEAQELRLAGDHSNAFRTFERALLIRLRFVQRNDEPPRGSSSGETADLRPHDERGDREHQESLKRLCRESTSRLVQYYNAQAVSLFRHRQFDSAGQLLASALRLAEGATDTDFLFGDQSLRSKLVSLTFNNLGCMERRRGRTTVAVQYLRQALECEDVPPANIVARLNLAAILVQLGQHPEAVGVCRMAIGHIDECRKREAPAAVVPPVANNNNNNVSAAVAVSKGLEAVAYHNLASALEFLDPREALQACQYAVHLASVPTSTQSTTTGSEAVDDATRAAFEKTRLRLQQSDASRGSSLGPSSGGTESVLMLRSTGDGGPRPAASDSRFPPISSACAGDATVFPGGSATGGIPAQSAYRADPEQPPPPAVGMPRGDPIGRGQSQAAYLRSLPPLGNADSTAACSSFGTYSYRTNPSTLLGGDPSSSHASSVKPPSYKRPGDHSGRDGRRAAAHDDEDATDRKPLPPAILRAALEPDLATDFHSVPPPQQQQRGDKPAVDNAAVAAKLLPVSPRAATSAGAAAASLTSGGSIAPKPPGTVPPTSPRPTVAQPSAASMNDSSPHDPATRKHAAATDSTAVRPTAATARTAAIGSAAGVPSLVGSAAKAGGGRPPSGGASGPAAAAPQIAARRQLRREEELTRLDDLLSYMSSQLATLLRIEDEYESRYIAARRIQCLVRQFIARQRRKHLRATRMQQLARRKKRERNAALAIIGFLKGLIGRRRRRNDRIKVQHHVHDITTRNAVTIQKYLRRWLAQKLSGRMRRMKARWNQSLLLLQRAFRHCLARMCARRMRVAYRQSWQNKQDQERMEIAVRRLQSTFRLHRARIAALILKGDIKAARELDRHRNREHAASLIGRFYKGYLVRRGTCGPLADLRKRRRNRERSQRKRDAVVLFQRAMRGVACRGALRFKHRLFVASRVANIASQRQAAARRIQCWVRQFFSVRKRMALAARRQARHALFRDRARLALGLS